LKNELRSIREFNQESDRSVFAFFADKNGNRLFSMPQIKSEELITLRHRKENEYDHRHYFAVNNLQLAQDLVGLLPIHLKNGVS
jgi:hypothetical protein